MRIFFLLYSLLFSVQSLVQTAKAADTSGNHYISFYGDTIAISPLKKDKRTVSLPIIQSDVTDFYGSIRGSDIDALVDTLESFKAKKQLDDWIFYQLIRAAAEKISPKAENYERYTIYKCYLLNRTGYASLLTTTGEKILLYVQSDDEVFEIPFKNYLEKQFVCLNYHDYGTIDFTKEIFREVKLNTPQQSKPFSYSISKLPEFNVARYVPKDLTFQYYNHSFDFRILVNPDIQKIFQNYPVLNYSYYFSMPMSEVTYSSLIPVLKQYLSRLDQKKGIEYLMHLTRNSFSFDSDTRQFGKEKRLSAEQTLLYSKSDCEDRSAFFFYLVKEIYNLPMIVLCFEDHVTVAVSLDKKVRKRPVKYKGLDYYVCEPTPQAEDLRIGELPVKLRKARFEIVYEYRPGSDGLPAASAKEL